MKCIKAPLSLLNIWSLLGRSACMSRQRCPSQHGTRHARQNWSLCITNETYGIDRSRREFVCVQERETQKYTHALMSVSSPPSFPINEDFVQFSFFSFLFQPFFINCSDVYGEGTWLSSSSSVKAHLLKNPKWLLSFTAVCFVLLGQQLYHGQRASCSFLWPYVHISSIAAKNIHLHNLLYSISEVLLWLTGAAHNK